MNEINQKNTNQLQNSRVSRKFSILQSLSSKQNYNSLRSADKNPHFQSLSRKYASKETMKVLHSNNRRDLLRKIVKKIQQRAQSFYKYGFKSYQKKDHEGIFQDVFNLQKNRLKGSIGTAQLWSNKDTIYFLKQNNMFLNKKNLVEQLKILKEQIKREEKSNMLESNIRFKLPKNRSLHKKQSLYNKVNTVFSVHSVSNDFLTCQTIRQDQIKSSKSNQEAVKSYKTDLKEITRKLKRLKCEKIKEDNIMDYLEKNHQRYQQIRQKYSDKLFLLN